MLESLQKKITTLAYAALLLVLGILCIIANAQANSGNYGDAADAYQSISTVVGIVLIVIAAIGLIFGLVLAILSRTGAFATGGSITSGLVLAAGIFFVSTTTAGDLIMLFLNFIPYVLVVLGAIVIVDAILSFVFAILAKKLKESLVMFIVKLVVGALVLTLGFVAMGDNWLGNNKLMIFGIVLCIYGVVYALSAFFAPTLLVVHTKESE